MSSLRIIQSTSSLWQISLFQLQLNFSEKNSAILHLFHKTFSVMYIHPLCINRYLFRQPGKQSNVVEHKCIFLKTKQDNSNVNPFT